MEAAVDSYTIYVQREEKDGLGLLVQWNGNSILVKSVSSRYAEQIQVGDCVCAINGHGIKSIEDLMFRTKDCSSVMLTFQQRNKNNNNNLVDTNIVKDPINFTAEKIVSPEISLLEKTKKEEFWQAQAWKKEKEELGQVILRQEKRIEVLERQVEKRMQVNVERWRPFTNTKIQTFKDELERTIFEVRTKSEKRMKEAHAIERNTWRTTHDDQLTALVNAYEEQLDCRTEQVHAEWITHLQNHLQQHELPCLEEECTICHLLQNIRSQIQQQAVDLWVAESTSTSTRITKLIEEYQSRRLLLYTA